MKVNKEVIKKIDNQQGYIPVELFYIKINKQFYVFYINKLVSWVNNQDKQYISVKHYTSKEQYKKNAWNNKIIFNDVNIPYSALDLVSLTGQEKRILNKFKNNIDNLLEYDL